MSDTKRALTGAEVHFKKSLWSSLAAIGSSLAFAGAFYASEREPWVLAASAIPLAYGIIDLLWALNHPLLSVSSWKIVHRPRVFTGAAEISRAEITSWRVADKRLYIERQGKKETKVNLGLLSGGDRRLVITVLRARGYADLEDPGADQAEGEA